MTFRGTNATTLDIVRHLIDEVDTLKRQVGSVKQNTIRLGDWVLEAVDDTVIKMTNLVTGEESYVGATTDIVFPTVPHEREYSYGGTVNPSTSSTGERWLPPVDLVLNELVLSLATVASAGSALQVRTYINDLLVRTDSLPLNTKSVTIPLGITLFKDQPLYPMLLSNATGNGVSLGIVYRWTEI